MFLSGFPVWLKYVPGISFRTDNGPFKVRHVFFFSKIIYLHFEVIKSSHLFIDSCLTTEVISSFRNIDTFLFSEGSNAKVYYKDC